jgi:hypothetical protein
VVNVFDALGMRNDDEEIKLPEQKPIGYWVKALDRALESHLDKRLAIHELGRREWQVLNVIAAKSVTLHDLEDELRPFSAEATSPNQAWQALTIRGLVHLEADGIISLTEEGLALHSEAAKDIQELRSAAAAGVDRDEYVTAVRVLATMLQNVTP